MENKERKSKPILSICVPTYNRAEKILSLVTEILTYPHDDLELVVLDNCSSDNTKKLLSAIKDKRFFFYENETNIGGKLNGVKALTYCFGDYVLVCLDKDYINYKYIYNLISFFKTYPDVVFGNCSATTQCQDSSIFEKGIESIKQFAYLGKHPSGFFYRNEILKKLSVYENRNFYNIDSGFVLDFVNAEMSLYGKSAQVSFPLVSTETKKEAAENVSHSYSGRDLFFLPEKQYDLFELIIGHVKTLKIMNSEKCELIKRLFATKLESSTFGYNSICKDLHICQHYNFRPRRTGLANIIYNDYLFCRKFILKCNYRNAIERFFISVEANVCILTNKLKNIVKVCMLYIQVDCYKFN